MTENSVENVVASNAPDLDDLGRRMGEQLLELQEEKDKVLESTQALADAKGRLETAERTYAEAISLVRQGGLITDQLLEQSGHPVPKRRGRPVKL